MPNTILIGAQWGDEGKGKIIDVITEDIDWIVRYQGGSNAGHTVEIGSSKYVLHLIPSGILRSGKKAVIGHGVVVDPIELVQEIKGVQDRGIAVEGRLFVSDRAHMVLPYHRVIDASLERARNGSRKIGTTQRGIGPAYGDKVARTGLRIGALLRPDLDERLRGLIEDKNRILEMLGGSPLNEDEILKGVRGAAEFLAPYITDTLVQLNQAVKQGESILFEGAQGTMLDVDYGTYPYVTSSSATAGGACTGTGIAPRHIHQVLGVVKAYTTRVGEGPFPTELDDADGQKLRNLGHEYGATTGRPRRCGWFDVVVARYSAMVNGVDQWALTKLDVLDQFETIRIGVGYRLHGKQIDTIPADVDELSACQPVYEEFKGWNCSTREIVRYEDLPAQAKAYIRRLEELTGVSVGILSLGPQRESTLRLNAVQPASAIG